MNDDSVVEESIKLGSEISKFSLPVLISCKDSILKGNYRLNVLRTQHVLAHELGLSDGLEYERKAFHSTFALVIY